MRLIDVDDLERVIKSECNPYGKPTIDFESGKRLLAIIENFPTIDSKCDICKYQACEITEKPCSECSRSWTDLYEEADVGDGAK